MIAPALAQPITWTYRGVGYAVAQVWLGEQPAADLIERRAGDRPSQVVTVPPAGRSYLETSMVWVLASDAVRSARADALVEGGTI